jgi:hypothetical protein
VARPQRRDGGGQDGRAEALRDAERDHANALARDAEARHEIVAGMRGVGDHSRGPRDARRHAEPEVPALRQRERLRKRVHGEVVHRDDRGHRAADGPDALRAVIERDAVPSQQARQRGVVPHDLMVRRRQRHGHGLDAGAGECVRAIGEHDVVVTAEPRERARQLRRVRRRAADDAELSADADPHRQATGRGAPAGAGAPPSATRKPARAPRPSARTTSSRPRNA